MKKLIFILSLMVGFAQAQMPNISKVWTNNLLPYKGGFGKEIPMSIYINQSDQNKKNDQEYFISGTSVKNNAELNIEGNLIINKYKDFKKHGKVFGTYEIAEENKGEASGIYKGKFIFSFDWDPKSKQITKKKIEFKGKWHSYLKDQIQKTYWTNE